MKYNLFEARFLKQRFLQYRADDNSNGGGGSPDPKTQEAAEKKVDEILSQVNNDEEPEPVVYNPAEGKSFKSIEELEGESVTAETTFLESLTEAEKKEYQKYDEEEKALFKSGKESEAKNVSRETKKKEAYEKLTPEEKLIWDKKNKTPEPKSKSGAPPKEEKNDTDDEGGELKFKVKDESEPTNEEVQSTWIDVAKEFGVEVKEDSLEAVKTALEKKYKDEQPAFDAEDALNKKVDALEPEAQKLFKFLQNKGKFEDYVKPVKQYDDLLALSNEDLVRKQLKLNKWDDDKIEEQVAVLKEEGKLDTNGYAIRKSLETAKATFEQELFQNQEQLAKADQVKLQQQRVKEDKAIRETLDKVEEYKGGKLPKEEREKIYKKWENGYYRRLMADDPKAVVDMILAYELTDQVIGSAKKSGKSEQVRNHQEKLHNVKKLNSEEGSSRTPKNIEVQEGTDFSKWKVDLETA